MKKFTAGPLVVKQGPDWTAIGFMRDGKFEATANLVEDDSGSYDTRITVSEAEANAHLYAAAPELLEALRRLVDATHDEKDCIALAVYSTRGLASIVQDAKDLIAKAEGK